MSIRWRTTVLVAAVAIATTVMLLIFYIVHEENPQGEFFDVHSGVPVLGSLVPLLAAWWLLPFAAIVLIGGALYLLRHLVRRKSTP